MVGKLHSVAFIACLDEPVWRSWGKTCLFFLQVRAVYLWILSDERLSTVTWLIKGGQVNTVCRNLWFLYCIKEKKVNSVSFKNNKTKLWLYWAVFVYETAVREFKHYSTTFIQQQKMFCIRIHICIKIHIITNVSLLKADPVTCTIIMIFNH